MVMTQQWRGDDVVKEDAMETGSTIAKTLLRSGWTFALFGLEQAAGWMVPGAGWRRSAAGVETLGRGARGELGAVLGRVYDTGERLGCGFLDTLTDLAAGGDQPAAAWEALGRAAAMPGAPTHQDRASEPRGGGK